MGQFTSYCRKCDSEIHWFLRLRYGHITCRKCEEINSQDDVDNSLNNKKYWDIFRRKEKIKKIKNKLNENSTNN